MYTKILLPLLLLSSLVLTTCEQEDNPSPVESNQEWFVFGVIDCSCSGCSRLFKIEGNQLFRQNEHSCKLDTISFPNDLLSASKLSIARKLMDEMPPDFFELPENQFDYHGPSWGLPVYTIQIARFGQIKTWTLSDHMVDIAWFPYADYWLEVYSTINKLE